MMTYQDLTNKAASTLPWWYPQVRKSTVVFYYVTLLGLVARIAGVL